MQHETCRLTGKPGDPPVRRRKERLGAVIRALGTADNVGSRSDLRSALGLSPCLKPRSVLPVENLGTGSGVDVPGPIENRISVVEPVAMLFTGWPRSDVAA